jgi:hypothetical protein
MGWNSFQSYGVYLHQQAARANLEAMAVKLKPHGYDTFVIDNGWFGEYKLTPGTLFAAEKHASDVHLNAYGLLQPSKTYFPAGLRPLIDRAHALGLKFGLHLMRGIPRKAVELNLPAQGTRFTARDVANTESICKWCHYNYGVNMAHPGGQLFYNSLVNQLASWGVDFLKVDDLVPYPAEVLGFANAIEQCGRPIVFSLSPGDVAPLTGLPYYRRANMLRVTADIWDRRADIESTFTAWRKWQGREYAGFWIDFDMLPFGQLQMMSPKERALQGEVRLAGFGNQRWCALSRDEMRSFLAQRALGASPLFVGGDLPTLDDFSLSLLTDRDMIECNQNGVMGALVHERDGVEAWLAAKRDAPGSGWLGIFNRNSSERTVLLRPANFGLDAPRYDARELWNGPAYSFESEGRLWRLPPGGVALVHFAAR